jgi:ABC-type amino acid transport substrate-binding protein
MSITTRLITLLAAALLTSCGGGEPEATPAVADETPQPYKEKVLDTIRERGTIRFGADGHSPPMMIMAGDGTYDGFEYRFQQAIGEALGVKAELVAVTWNDQTTVLRAGLIDAVLAGWIPNSAVDASFSDSYLESGLCLIVKKGSAIRTMADLPGKKVAIYNDPATELWADKHLTKSTVQVMDDGYFGLLAAGDLDAVVYDYPFAVGKLQAYRDRLRIVELNVHPFGYSVLLPNDNQDLLEAVNTAIGEVRARGDYAKWIREFFPMDGDMAQVLDLAPPTLPPGAKTHVARGDEQLRDVAKRYYGDDKRWLEIWKANRGHIAFPEWVPKGTKLVIP